MIDHLRKLPVEVVERFLDTRDFKQVGIPQPLAEYILQVNEASNLLKKYQSITECAKQLQRVYRMLSVSTCKDRIYDAINYLNADCSVTSEAWNLFYADKVMRLFEVNLVAHDFKEARECIEDARAWNLLASGNAVNPDRIKFKPQIVSADMKLMRMGIEKQGLLSAYEKAMKLINDFDISSTDKDRLRTEVSRELDIDIEGEDNENT